MGLFEDIRAADAILGRPVVDAMAAEHSVPATLADLVNMQHNVYADALGAWHEFVAVSLPQGSGEASDNVSAAVAVPPIDERERDPWICPRGGDCTVIGCDLDHPEALTEEWYDLGTCSGCGAYGKLGLAHLGCRAEGQYR